MTQQQISSAAYQDRHSQTSKDLLAFFVAEQWFALPVENVQAVVHADDMQPILGQDTDLAGYVQIRNQEVLALNLTPILSQQAPAEAAEQIILFKTRQFWAALTTPGIAEVLNIPPDQIRQPPKSRRLPPWIKATCQANGRTIALLNIDLLVDNFCPTA